MFSCLKQTFQMPQPYNSTLELSHVRILHVFNKYTSDKCLGLNELISDQKEQIIPVDYLGYITAER